MQMSGSPILVPSPGLFSFCRFVLSNSSVLGFFFFLNLFLFCFIITPQKPFLFLMGDRKGVDLDGTRGGEELKGTKRRETVIGT